MSKRAGRGRGKPAGRPRSRGSGAEAGALAARPQARKGGAERAKPVRTARAPSKGAPAAPGVANAPGGTTRVARLEQVKVMAHPLRLRMLHLFGETPRTAKQVAAILGEKPTRLYHHVDAMARVGLIELVETRQNRGATEKYYRTAARRFEVRHEPSAEGVRDVDTIGMIRTVVEAARDEALDYFTGPHEKPAVSPMVIRARIQGSAEEIEALRQAVLKVLEMHPPRKRKGPEQAAIQYALTILLHPAPEE